MYTIMLYIVICTNPDRCFTYEPAYWFASNKQEELVAFEECRALEQKIVSVKEYKESGCYIPE